MLPQYFNAMIKARKGYQLFAADYSAIENVVLLWVAGETKQLPAIRDGLSHYRLFASRVYNEEYENVTSDQRFLGKVGILGCGYNAGAHGFLLGRPDWMIIRPNSDDRSAASSRPS